MLRYVRVVRELAALTCVFVCRVMTMELLIAVTKVRGARTRPRRAVAVIAGAWCVCVAGEGPVVAAGCAGRQGA